VLMTVHNFSTQYSTPECPCHPPITSLQHIISDINFSLSGTMPNTGLYLASAMASGSIWLHINDDTDNSREVMYLAGLHQAQALWTSFLNERHAVVAQCSQVNVHWTQIGARRTLQVRQQRMKCHQLLHVAYAQVLSHYNEQLCKSLA